MKTRYWPRTFSVYQWGLVEGHPYSAGVAWSEAYGYSLFRRGTQEAQSLLWRFADGSIRMDTVVNTHHGRYAFWTEQVVRSRKKESVIDRIAHKCCATDMEELASSEQLIQSTQVCCLVKRVSPALKYLFDERLQIPLQGEAQYEGSTRKWTVSSLAESAQSGKLIEVETLEDTFKILPLQTADQDEMRRLTCADSSIQDALTALNLPDLTSSWLKL